MKSVPVQEVRPVGVVKQGAASPAEGCWAAIIQLSYSVWHQNKDETVAFFGNNCFAGKGSLV